MSGDAFNVALALEMHLGEGPLWHASRGLQYWVDINGFALHHLDPVTGEHAYVVFDEEITCVAPGPDGRLIAACRSGLWQLDEADRKAGCLVEAPYETTDHRFNDGGCDPAGRFWIGAMNERVDNRDASLYRYDGDTLVTAIPDMTITNGLAFSPDGAWLYHTDTPTRVIRRHAFDRKTGEIDAGQTWIDLNQLDIEGSPDGAAVDTNGDYWTALFGGAAVARFDADGELVARYPLNALQPTMPCFGGPDRRTLYVTTAREAMTAEDVARWPDSGALLSMPVETPGLAITPFCGTKG
ncbi:SMP-30/gluconolactonase/LRE family protein [Salinisphaera sp. Q1T1-3]|uniref:SMP-30/gluconolactonase/LRE family protein n=1 Tax=Salinisphaera sp. Q1T1-3 TaxID=2321229 RepID=UPI000E70A8DF|nr:SMP-30/gluconolactonase/LRE family protein [Salinisphaera sp. Q1T1-3]RJS93023.1 SMP-30/gluconolactonase/LRE family protein [Salinisphaera sp. Q1T1-3]